VEGGVNNWESYFRHNGRFQQTTHKEFVIANNSNGRGSMSPLEWEAKCTRDRQRVATAGGFGSWNEKCASDQQDAATASGYSNWKEKDAGDKQDAATVGGYSNFSELLANKPQRGKNKHGKNLDLGKRNLGQKKAEAQLSALNELTGDAKWETVRSKPSHAHAWGVQYYSHPSMKGRKSGPKAMEFAVANAKKRKQVPRIAEFFSPVSDKIAAPCSDSDFE